MRWCLLALLNVLPLSCLASIEFIVTNSQEALANAQQDAFSVGSVVILVVASIVVVTLILSMLRKV